MTDYIDAVIGEREGFLAFAFGRDTVLGRRRQIRHRDWTETRFQWPAERDKIRLPSTRNSPAGNRSTSTSARPSDSPTTGAKAPHCRPWCAGQTSTARPADVALWDTINPYVVDSGQPDHRHAYVPLTRPVGLGAHARLNKALANRLGGDAKWSDESLLRLPGSLNFKPATPRNGEPAGHPARVLAQPWSGAPWDPEKLAEILGVDLEQSDGTKPARPSRANPSTSRRCRRGCASDSTTRPSRRMPPRPSTGS